MSEWEIIETEDAMPIVNALKEKTKFTDILTIQFHKYGIISRYQGLQNRIKLT